VLGDSNALRSVFAQIGLARSEAHMHPGLPEAEHDRVKADARELTLILDHLTSLGLLDSEPQLFMRPYLERIFDQIDPRRFAEGKQRLSIREPHVATRYSLSGFGIEFVRACRGPQDVATDGSHSV
jgi:hypothetical protein